MTLNFLRRVAVFAVVCQTWVSGVAFAADEVAIPPLTARVTDLTATLSAEQKQQLEATLAKLEADKGSQVAILMLPTTQPEAIEQFGIRLAEAWKVGRKGTDDGVIVIVAKDDRTARIEVGYGLEGAIPDAVAKRIVDGIMIPRFKEGDFHGGLRDAVDALGRIIGGEALPAPARSGTRNAVAGGDLGNLIPVAMVFIFVVGGLLRAVLGRAAGAGVGGVIAFFGAWLLLGSLALAIVVAVIAFIFTLAGGGRFGGPGGGLGGGGFGGGFGGGGGFSGGGGGFGGGGASGRW